MKFYSLELMKFGTQKTICLTLCTALTKQLLGSLVGEGAVFSPIVDGDAVDDVEEED